MRRVLRGRGRRQHDHRGGNGTQRQGGYGTLEGTRVRRVRLAVYIRWHRWLSSPGKSGMGIVRA
jgi:hypothetical protein